jgi:hypothetical protein
MTKNNKTAVDVSKSAKPTSEPTSSASSTNSPSPANNSPRVSRYRASEEEQERFARESPSELIITMSNVGPSKK